MSTHLVFVYGTLKSCGWNHSLLRDATPLGDAVTVDPCLMIGPDGAVPRVFRADESCAPADHGRIVGELYEVDDDQLAALDHLEGHPTAYTRELTPVMPEDDGHRPVNAWLYFVNRKPNPEWLRAAVDGAHNWGPGWRA